MATHIKEKHLVGVGLPVLVHKQSSWKYAWQHAGRHGAEEGAESSTSGSTGSRRKLCTTLGVT